MPIAQLTQQNWFLLRLTMLPDTNSTCTTMETLPYESTWSPPSFLEDAMLLCSSHIIKTRIKLQYMCAHQVICFSGFLALISKHFFWANRLHCSQLGPYKPSFHDVCACLSPAASSKPFAICHTLLEHSCTWLCLASQLLVPFSRIIQKPLPHAMVRNSCDHGRPRYDIIFKNFVK